MRYIQCSPKVSIIIPVFNNEKFLTRCLDSIIAQSYDDWECILVDDGSSDNSGMICEDYAKKDKRLRVIHQKNAGVSIARNVGLDASYGEWICFVDSDDWIDNNLISELLSCAEKNDAEVVVSGNKRVDYEKILKEENPPEGMLAMPEDFEVYLQGPCSKLFKRTVLDKHNIRFPENISLAEDLLFTFKVFFSTKKVWGVSKSFYNYYQNQYSAVHTISPEKIEDEKKVLKIIEDLLIQNNADKDWYDFLNERKCRAKNKYVFLLKTPDYKAWRNCYPELYKTVKSYCGFDKKFFFFFIQHKLDFFANCLFLIWKRRR